MDTSVNSSPTSYTSSGKDDTLNSAHPGNVTTPNTSVSTSALGPIGSKSSTPNPAAVSSGANTNSPWSSLQQQQQLRKGPGGGAIGSERSVSSSSANPSSNQSASSVIGNIGIGGGAASSDWFSPLKSAPGFERSRIGQYQQQQQQGSNNDQQGASNQQPHPGMQGRSISTTGIASIGSGRRQVSEANSVRSSRPASPTLSVITSPSVNTSPSSFNPQQVNNSLTQTLQQQQQNGPSFLVQDQSHLPPNAATPQNGTVASTPSELESAFDAMLRGSSLFNDLVNRVNRLESQIQQLASSQDASSGNFGQANGHYDATPTRSPSVAGSTSSYLTAHLVGGGGNRPQSLLLPNHAPSPAGISTSLHSPALPMQHASTEPSTPLYGPPSNGPAERDVIRQLTVQLSALGNNVAQLMAQQQQMPQTPLGAPNAYDQQPPTPHSAHGHPGMHGNHHHGGMGGGRPGMQNMRGASFDIPRGPVVPRGGPLAAYGDEREPRNKRNHLNLQAPTPVGMGSRRSSADVIENMHNVAEGMPGSAGGPGVGSQSLLGKWEALGVSGDMLRAIVKYGIGPPSKIQMKAIPCVLNTQDIVAQASSIQERIQCYVIPTLQVVYNNLQQASLNEGTEQPYHGVQALVLTATIDQAGQAQRMCLGLGQALGITSSLVVGHGDISQEAAAFANNPPHVLVGTPQKLLDLLNQRTVPVDRLSLLVIDEMDQLIARNLSEYVNNLAKLLPPPMSSAASSRERSPALNGPGSGFKPFEQGPGRSHERQTAIFSCTVPQEVLNFASALNLREPVRVLVRRENNNNSNNNNNNSNNNSNNSNNQSSENSSVTNTPNIRGVKHWFLYLAVGNGGPQGRGPMGRQESASSREWKLEALADLCVDADVTQAVVYCSSIDSVEAVAYKLASRNLDALALHGDMGASARHAIVSKFRSGNVGQGRGMAAKRILVVYDALCRTLSDIHQVAMVVNFDLPRAVEDYTHRVSCAASTGYGRSGSSVNIVSSSADIDMLRNIESYYRLKINELPPNLSNII